ncbi:MAG: hypothetical protein GY807_01370 [Gammaproteobacteria bacterium]|nr:hypothetical protein [Gammaproteobacteria bacterium]
MTPYFETAGSEWYQNRPLLREALLADELLAHLAQHGDRSLPGQVVRKLRNWPSGTRRTWPGCCGRWELMVRSC